RRISNRPPAAQAGLALRYHDSDAGAVRSAPHRADQRRLLRDAEPGAVGHLRPAQHHQLRARRAVHDGRLRRVLRVAVGRPRLLAVAADRAGRGRPLRGGARAHDAQAALPPRSPLRVAADVRRGAGRPGALPQRVRLIRVAVRRPAAAHGRLQPRLHVPAGVSGLGGRLLARRVPDHLVRDRADETRRLPAGGHRDPDARAGLRHHGARPAGATDRAVRTHDVSVTAKPAVAAPRARVATGPALATHQVAAFVVMVALLVSAPFFVYPVFLMKALCFALFACAFNLLLGYVGLLSFGHAAFLGSAGYASAHAAKVWGWPPELAILFGTVMAGALGIVIGALTIRSRGIYFANITLAFAQMIFFFSLQAKFTGGEDG